MLGLLVCGRVPSDATKNFSFTAARCLFSTYLNLWLDLDSGQTLRQQSFYMLSF